MHLDYAAAFKDSVLRFNYAQRHTETKLVEGDTTQRLLGDLKLHNKIVYVTARSSDFIIAP